MTHAAAFYEKFQYHYNFQTEGISNENRIKAAGGAIYWIYFTDGSFTTIGATTA